MIRPPGGSFSLESHSAGAFATGAGLPRLLLDFDFSMHGLNGGLDSPALCYFFREGIHSDAGPEFPGVFAGQSDGFIGLQLVGNCGCLKWSTLFAITALLDSCLANNVPVPVPASSDMIELNSGSSRKSMFIAILSSASSAPADYAPVPIQFWALFVVFVLAMLAVDLFAFGRGVKEVPLRQALGWSVLWLALGFAFNVLIYFWLGKQPAVEFLTGFLVEKALAVDNIFVFAMIFSYFLIPLQYQHKVLFWGIFLALLMRAAFIFAGVQLVTRFEWTLWVFGAFLIFTGLKMIFSHGKKMEPEKNPLVKVVKRFMPVTDELHGENFTISREGRTWATPLLIVLVLVAFCDLIFALDSIPAILAITKNPFIVLTSNVFAILGLRALYFALAGVIDTFHLLHYGLSAVLIFIGTKMCIMKIYHIPTPVSLGVVALCIAAGIVASIMIKPRHEARGHGSHADGTPAYDYPEDAALH